MYRTLYDILGLSTEASADDIRRMYRRLAMQWHPDRNPEAGADDMFRAIRGAYEILSDAEQRALYDGTLGLTEPAGDADARDAAPAADSDPNPAQADAAADADASASTRPGRTGPGADGPTGHGSETPADAASERSGDVDGSGAGNPTDPSAVPGAGDLRRRLAIRLDEQIEGCHRTLDISRTPPCSRCEGRGRVGDAVLRCRSCSGRGTVSRGWGLFATPFMGFGGREPCAACDGQGQTIGTLCEACEGSGNGPRSDRRFEIDVPPGMEPGRWLRLNGLGRPGGAGRRAGDLLVQITLAPDERFQPDDFPHLQAELPVLATRWAQGGSLSITGPDGAPLALALQPMQALLVLPGAGLRHPDGSRGELRLHLRPWWPSHLDDAQQALADRLEQAVMASPPADVLRWQPKDPAAAGRSRRKPRDEAAAGKPGTTARPARRSPKPG